MLPAEESAALPPRPQEQLLIDALAWLPAGRLLTNTVGRAQFAQAYAAAHPTAKVVCWSLDLYQHQQIEAALGETARVQSVCQADLPTDPCDVAALALSKQGDGELARDLLQQAFLALREGGTLVASTDNPDDTWLGEQCARFATKVTRHAFESGAVYALTRTEPLKKIKRYDAEVVFRDHGNLLKLVTRPGVFNHRQLDAGARALLNATAVDVDLNVLDIGCGSGAVALGIAARDPSLFVYAIDSNARAVECTERNAAANNLTNVSVALDCDGSSVDEGDFDLAVANPPYYSNFRIAELFVQIAAKALCRGGQLLVVTKTPEWYAENLPALGFGYSDVAEAKNYTIVQAERD